MSGSVLIILQGLICSTHHHNDKQPRGLTLIKAEKNRVKNRFFRSKVHILAFIFF